MSRRSPLAAQKPEQRHERHQSSYLYPSSTKVLAYFSIGTITTAAYFASSQSSSTSSSNNNNQLIKGILIGATSTICSIATACVIIIKKITTTRDDEEKKKKKNIEERTAEFVEGEFETGESLLGEVKGVEHTGWLIFSKASGSAKNNNRNSKNSGNNSNNNNSSNKNTNQTANNTNNERWYARLDLKQARIALSEERNGDAEKFIDLRKAEIFLIDYKRGNKKELMWSHKRAILIKRCDSAKGALYEGERSVFVYALSAPSKEAWFYALWRAVDMDRSRDLQQQRLLVQEQRQEQQQARSFSGSDLSTSMSEKDSLVVVEEATTTTTNNKQIFPEHAKTRIAQYLVENARYERSPLIDKTKDGFFEHIFDDKRCGATVDIMSSRVFFDLVRSIDFRNVLSNMFEKKLNELPGLPKYVGKFEIEKLALGEATPKCNSLRSVDTTDGSNAPWDGGSLPGRGICAALEADLSYVGLIEVTIRTRVDLAQYAREIGNLVDGESTEEENNNNNSKMNNTDSGESTPTLLVTPPLSPTNSGRITTQPPPPPPPTTISKVVVKKEEVTQNVLKEVKKVVENVNERFAKVPLKMTLKLNSCSGTFRFWIPPPPNERLWWGLKGRPRVDIFCEPAIGENKIAHEFLAKKISQLLSSKLVSDICDELVLPNCASDPMKELIRFEDEFIPEISLEDAMRVASGLVEQEESLLLATKKDSFDGKKRDGEELTLSKPDSANAAAQFSALLFPDAPTTLLRKIPSLKRESSKKLEEKNALDATAEWLLSDSHFDSPPMSASKPSSASSSSQQQQQPLSPQSSINNMVGFGNKREDVLKAKSEQQQQPIEQTTTTQQQQQPNIFASFKTMKQAADKNIQMMKSDFLEVQKSLSSKGVEGAVQNIKSIASKRAKEVNATLKNKPSSAAPNNNDVSLS